MKFVNPNILFALFLIIIPIIIHLFNLKRYKLVYFTNVKFLKEISEETKKQSVLRHLLVLMARILTIIFIVFAFARPYIPGKQEGFIITDRDFVSVFLDNSFSMQAVGTYGTLLETAVKKARDIFKSHRSTDAFQILTNDFEGVHQRIIASEEIGELLNGIEHSFYHRKLSEIVSRQKNLSATFSGDQKICYIISDFQKSIVDFENISDDSLNRFILIPINAKKTNNLFVDSCWFDAPIKRLNQSVALNVRIQNYADDYVEKVPAKLFINGEQRALSGFDCDPNSAVVIQLPFVINQTGVHNGYVEILDYPVSYDDRMYFSFTVQKTISILSINNQNDNRYISTLFKNDSAFVIDNVSSLSLDYSMFMNYNFIILNGFDDISSGLANELHKYVENGGHFLLVPGTKSDLISYTSFLSMFVPLAIEGLDTQKVKINYINLNHPLYMNVFDDIPENVMLPDVKQHYNFVAKTGTFSEELLRMQNGRPFLSAYNFGQGILYTMASPLDSDFTSFPLHAIFVPTLYNMALNSISGSHLYYVLGKDVSINLSNFSKNNSLFKMTSVSDAYEFIPQQRFLFSRVVLNVYDQVKSAGVYNLEADGHVLAGLAFNYNREESKLDYYSAAELNKKISDKGLKNFSVLDIKNKSIAGSIIELDKGILLYKLFVILALVFCAVEILLLRFLK